MRKSYFIVVFLINIAHAQNETLLEKVQYGATLKAKIEFTPNSKNEPKLNFRVSTDVGIAGKWMANELYPSVNAELQLYNGGLGSRSLPDFRYGTFDALVAFTLTCGHLHDNFGSPGAAVNRFVPLRYFADFAIPALQNPYNYSISLGTNIVFSTDRGRTFQRLGFLNLNHSGFQLSYYNDGTPFQYFLLGDGKDRYYTGGGVLSYNNGIASPEHLDSYSFEVSYHKFSGFTQNAFEMSNSINASNVDYKSFLQKNYNKSLWKFNVQTTNEDGGFSLAWAYYNSVKFDGQHLIHWIIDNSFHIVPYKGYWDLEPSAFIISNDFKK